jgi:uncharacterized protein with GYD domain
MALYMYQASYTAKSMAAQIKEPQDPVESIKPALEDVGATILVAGFPFGEYDVLVVYEAPDDMTAASVAMAVAAAGEVKSAKTTRLLSGQEWLESLRKRRIVNIRKARQPDDHRRQSPEPLQSGSRSADATMRALRGGRGTGQEIAAFTSSAIFFSTTGLHFSSAYATGHMSPSSRFAGSWKPRVA